MRKFYKILTLLFMISILFLGIKTVNRAHASTPNKFFVSYSWDELTETSSYNSNLDLNGYQYKYPVDAIANDYVFYFSSDVLDDFIDNEEYVDKEDVYIRFGSTGLDTDYSIDLELNDYTNKFIDIDFLTAGDIGVNTADGGFVFFEIYVIDSTYFNPTTYTTNQGTMIYGDVDFLIDSSYDIFTYQQALNDANSEISALEQDVIDAYDDGYEAGQDDFYTNGSESYEYDVTDSYDYINAEESLQSTIDSLNDDINDLVLDKIDLQNYIQSLEDEYDLLLEDAYYEGRADGIAESDVNGEDSIMAFFGNTLGAVGSFFLHLTTEIELFGINIVMVISFILGLGIVIYLVKLFV